MRDIVKEVGLVLRVLRNAPAFALTAAGTLGLAIGASTAIFALVDAVLLEPLPYRDPDRLVMLQGAAPGKVSHHRGAARLGAGRLAVGARSAMVGGSSSQCDRWSCR